MSTSRRRAATATLIGSSANTLLVSLQAIVLIPLYLKTIGPRLYGAWLGSGDILVWMYAFDLGLPNLMIQRIGAAHGRGDMRSVAEYFATGMLVLAVVAALIALVGFAISFLLPSWMGLAGYEARTLRLCFTVGSLAQAVNIFNNSIVGFSRGVQNTSFLNAIVIVSAIAGFGMSLSLVLTGWGLWAIAFGLVVRAGVSLAGGVLFAVGALRRGLLPSFRVRRSILREFVVISPATALGGLSYAVMNQSETALVAIFVMPELAAVFALTRKALEMARGLIDTIAFATYGGFAHLVTSNERQRALWVHTEIHSLRLSLSLAMAAAYVAVNGSLLSVWVGSSQYGGLLLTILMAAQFVVVGSSFLMNYLYRAAGPVMRGSVALLVESLLRVPLMIGLLLWLGLPGIPIAAILTASLFAWLAYRWTLGEISPFSEPVPHTTSRVWVARALIVGIGVLSGLLLQWNSWIYVLVAGSIIGVGGSVLLICLDPLLGGVRAPITAVVNRLRPA